MAVSAPTASTPERPGAGIPGSELPGPYGVGEYALALRARLRAFARVQLVGELVNLRRARTRVHFELRDAGGAVPCAVWLDDWEAILARTAAAGAGEASEAKDGIDGPDGRPGANGSTLEGMQVVVAGGCDFYPGSATSSPGFSFSVADLRVAGEGDLLARIERLRRQLDAEGLLDPQKRLPRPLLPRTIGVVTGEGGKARDDILAGLRRRGWAGQIVWGFAPVQDRHAAPLIARALTDLAAIGEVDVAIVARGGGSLADLLCFCEESLCRTVALLAVPVIASVGHHTDRTLLDDVAAVSCSTPTHAAEAAVGLDCARARAELVAGAQRLRTHGRRAVLARARALTTLTRAPAVHVERQRARLHQRLREIRASGRRRVQSEGETTARRAIVLERKSSSTVRDCRTRRPQELQRLALALAGHDPQRTLERGYALVQTRAGEPIDSAQAAAQAHKIRLRFADDSVAAKIVQKP
jgi:exodeoxyribonuclease VII large subunit